MMVLRARRGGIGSKYVTLRGGAVAIAAELDADSPIGVVELGLFGGGEIPVADDEEVRRDLVDDGTPGQRRPRSKRSIGQAYRSLLFRRR
jgi:hypothetical protein